MKVPAGPPSEVAAKLVCQCGCNLVLVDCPHEECPSRPGMVQKIQAHLASGLDVEGTTGLMAVEYGSQVLAAPPFRSHPLAWIMPSAALALGTVLVLALIGKWSRKAVPIKAKPGVEPRADLLEKLERDLKERP